MPDARGGFGSESHTKILRACEKCWPLQGPHGLPNRSDCSGFVKAVMAELGLASPFLGDANAMYDAVAASADWNLIGSGGNASRIAGISANEGRFVLALWKNPKGGHGHVSIVVGDMSNTLKRQRIEGNVMGYWGQFGGDGFKFEKLTQSYGASKLIQVRYAAHKTHV